MTQEEIRNQLLASAIVCRGPYTFPLTLRLSLAAKRRELITGGNADAFARFVNGLENVLRATAGLSQTPTLDEYAGGALRLIGQRKGCGASWATSMAETLPYDGKDHHATCPKCGITWTRMPPCSDEEYAKKDATFASDVQALL